MTRDQALSVLRRAMFETFPDDVIREAASLVFAPLPSTPPRGFGAAPAGCAWHRPENGWVDLVRSSQ